MNEEQLKQFLNGEVEIILRGINEVKSFYEYCEHHNIECNGSVTTAKAVMNGYDDIIYAFIVHKKVLFFHKSIYHPNSKSKVIYFDENIFNSNSNKNKLISWIKK